MKKTRSAIRIPMPLRYLINLVLILALWLVLFTLIQNGTITNYWSGILITVGINIILATSLNVATRLSGPAASWTCRLYGGRCIRRRHFHEGRSGAGTSEIR